LKFGHATPARFALGTGSSTNEEYIETVVSAIAKVEALSKRMEHAFARWPLCPLAEAIMALRGVGLIYLSEDLGARPHPTGGTGSFAQSERIDANHGVDPDTRDVGGGEGVAP
jgi:hypothetical protein